MRQNCANIARNIFLGATLWVPQIITKLCNSIRQNCAQIVPKCAKLAPQLFLGSISGNHFWATILCNMFGATFRVTFLGNISGEHFWATVLSTIWGSLLGSVWAHFRTTFFGNILGDHFRQHWWVTSVGRHSEQHFGQHVWQYFHNLCKIVGTHTPKLRHKCANSAPMLRQQCTKHASKNSYLFNCFARSRYRS